MEEGKNVYYIAIETGEIMRKPTVSPWSFKIYASDEEITSLRELFDANYSVEIGNFLRAHIPYREYHKDSGNDQYDDHLRKIYQMIYELGDEEAKQHIEEMGDF
ncbi:hypothetical protein [Bacillus badius]|uniref:Hydrolase n=1 Tax=Bacillus badius TaxID=1455 RepID=A0ABR5ASW7_BACBA|nr:hypothetical protein [Bacillus badius]KIL75720.1 hypothetical protein SD78_2789 [Bacillus badius]KIL77854.1 hypothetical protein SD77_1183 [Bacillus badius]KZR59176.1 hydrolase [Bacillus badius]MED4715644.1 hydrolase [Bacillus badius]